MSNSPQRIEHEIQALVDGHLSADEERQLVDRIAKDPELVDLLVSYTGLDIAITKALRFSPEKFRDVQNPMRIERPKPVGRVILAAAALVAAMATVLWLVVPPVKPPHVVLRGSPGTSYKILKAVESPDKKTPSGLFAGDGIAISQGVVELEFASGVTGILQGPAELWIEKEHFVRLEKGKARFHVPPAMSGFRVTTEDVRAIDLGTEFAIKVIEDGPDEVHVIQGRVDVSPIGSPERGEVLGASQARKMLHHGLPQAIPYEGEEFLEALPAGLPYLHFPMETGPDGVLVVHGNINGETGVTARYVAGDAERESVAPAKGRFGEALEFNGRGDHVVTDWMGVGDDDPRTVAFWARLPKGAKSYDTACVVWGYRPPGKETVNRKWNVQLALDQKTHSRTIVNATFGGLWMEGRTSLDDGNWHHVAAVYTGRNTADDMPDLRLYVDGEPETGQWVWNKPIDRLDGDVRVRTETRAEIGAQPLCLARAMQATGRSFFKGALDEVYVIAGALRPEDIQSLWRNNRFESGPVIREIKIKDGRARSQAEE